MIGEYIVGSIERLTEANMLEARQIMQHIWNGDGYNLQFVIKLLEMYNI